MIPPQVFRNQRTRRWRVVADENPLRVLQFEAGQEADFDALLQGRGDAAQHLQGVAIAVRIFEPGNNGLGRADLPRQLGLRELGLRA